jgi:hypothetical protein
MKDESRVPGFPDWVHGDLPRQADGRREPRGDGLTYDAIQRGAVLMACALCLRSYFVTRPNDWRVCAGCR